MRAENGVDYQLIEVEFDTEEGAPANHLHHANFMRILAPEGATLVEARPRLNRWWSAMKNRPSMRDTRSPLEE